MSARSLGSAFAVGIDVLRTVLSDATGLIMAQLGRVTSEAPETNSAEWWQHVGFISRPSAASPKKSAAQVVTLRRGDRDVAIASRDARGAQLAGNVKDGETTVYAGGADGSGQARVTLKADGSVTVMTTDSNTASGNAVYLRLAVDGLSFVAPWGTLTFDATGFHVKTNAGPRLDLGGGSIPGVPSAIASGVSTYANLQAGVVSCLGNLVNLGNGPSYVPVLAFQGGMTPPLVPIAGPTTPLFGGPLPTGNQAGSVQVSVT